MENSNDQDDDPKRKKRCSPKREEATIKQVLEEKRGSRVWSHRWRRNSLFVVGKPEAPSEFQHFATRKSRQQFLGGREDHVDGKSCRVGRL
jgi:hypothetical protein